jgi:hemolysin III
MLEKFREPVNGLTHLGAALIAVIGLIYLLVRGQGDLSKMVALLIYGASLVLMFSASAAYHLVKGQPQVVHTLRILDHTAIYLLIAGTYTPICVIFFTGSWRWGFLAVIWSIAVIGIITKIFIVRAPRWISAVLYLLMGWLSIFGIQEMLRTIPTGGLLWLAAGGLLYTIGAIVYILKWPDFVPGVFGFHEVWHIFVILGAFSHFILIAVYAAAPGLPI